jgi:hypothetical protein
MSNSEGKEVFESYLYSLEQGDHDLTAASSTSDMETHFAEYLQTKLSEKYNDPQLEFVQSEASAAYDIARVRACL